MTDVPAVGRRILRLLAVERGLQDEGQGNAARLFRAAALGEALRATRVHPRLGRGLEQAAMPYPRAPRTALAPEANGAHGIPHFCGLT
jgi:hypothetical protein